MKRLIVIFTLIPLSAFARSYDQSHLSYTDAAPNPAVGIAVSVLTEEGILQGNPDGTFRYNALLNRAEFLKIVLLSHPKTAQELKNVNSGQRTDALNCFPDVRDTDWFAPYVCTAQEAGIVSGYPDGLFRPEQSVNYAEALKMLGELFGIVGRVPSDAQWFAPYREGAYTTRIGLPGMERQMEYLLTRGEMARLVVRYLAFDAGELAMLFDAEAGRVSSRSRVELSVSSTSVTSSNSSSLTASAASVSSKTSETRYDTHGGDTSMRSTFILLGEISPILASANIFSDAEPIRLTAITVSLTADNPGISGFEVYDEQGKYLGIAYHDSGALFRLPMKNSNVVIPKRETFSFYVRAIMRPFRSGGTSGDTVQISSLGIEGDGEWSNRSYSQATNETFNAFQTSRSVITGIFNADTDTAPLAAGPVKVLGMYRFEGRLADGSAELHITDIDYFIEQIGGVTIENVTLGVDGTSARHACSVSSSIVSCAAIPAEFGSIDSGARTLSLYGDVTIPEGTDHAALRLTINQPGTPSSAGDITWSDGDMSFTWVPGDPAVVRGTYYSY